MITLKIDKEFEALCPPLSAEESELLAHSIRTEGVRDPICTWNGVIVDGHRRYRICKGENLPFRTQELQFETRDAVMQWILLNQLGRRNLVAIQTAYFRGKYYRSFGLSRGGCGNRHQPCFKKGEKKNAVADKLGQQFKVSQATIIKDAHLADAIDSLEPTVREAVLGREIFASKQHVIELSGLSHKSQLLVIDAIRKGDLTSLQDAIFKLRPKAIQNASPTKCKTCGMKLAAGVVVCLRCDLKDADVKCAIHPEASHQEPGEPAAGWQDRLNALRKAKEAGDQIVFYAREIQNYLKVTGLQRNTPTHRVLTNLYDTLGQHIGKNGKYSRKQTA